MKFMITPAQLPEDKGIILNGHYFKYCENHPIAGIHWILQDEPDHESKSDYIDFVSEMAGSDEPDCFLFMTTVDEKLWLYTVDSPDSDLPVCIGSLLSLGKYTIGNPVPLSKREQVGKPKV